MGISLMPDKYRNDFDRDPNGYTWFGRPPKVRKTRRRKPIISLFERIFHSNQQSDKPPVVRHVPYDLEKDGGLDVPDLASGNVAPAPMPPKRRLQVVK